MMKERTNSASCSKIIKQAVYTFIILLIIGTIVSTMMWYYSQKRNIRSVVIKEYLELEKYLLSISEGGGKT